MRQLTGDYPAAVQALEPTPHRPPGPITARRALDVFRGGGLAGRMLEDRGPGEGGQVQRRVKCRRAIAVWVWRNERGKRTISCLLPFGKDSAMPDSDTPVLDTLAVMTAASLESSDLPPREFMIARIAALVAVDAPAASYALNVEAAADSDVTLDDVEDILVAVAPIVGTARVVSAAANIARGLGFVVAIAEAELEAELEAEADDDA